MLMYVVMLDHHPVDGKINARLGVDLQKGTFHRIVSSGMGGWGYPVRTGGCCEYVQVRIKEKGRS